MAVASLWSTVEGISARRTAIVRGRGCIAHVHQAEAVPEDVCRRELHRIEHRIAARVAAGQGKFEARFAKVRRRISSFTTTRSSTTSSRTSVTTCREMNIASPLRERAIGTSWSMERSRSKTTKRPIPIRASCFEADEQTPNESA